MAFEFNVYEGRIAYADPIKQVYEVYIAETGKTITGVPMGVRRMREGAVAATDTYMAGDIVLVTCNKQTANAPGALPICIILGTFPGDAKSYIDDPDEVEGQAKEFYEESERCIGRKNKYEASSFATVDRGSVVSGDYTIGGADAHLHITDRMTSLGSTDAELTTNALDGSITTDSLVREDRTAGVVEAVKIVNETVLKTTELYGSVNTVKQPKPSFVEHTGDLPYGNVRTMYDWDGKPISQVSQANDGSIAVSAATGVHIARTTGIVGYTDSYRMLINRDTEIGELDEDSAYPYDRVAKSAHWTKHGAEEELYSRVMPVCRPAQPAEPVNAEYSKDTTSTNNSWVAPCSSFIDVRPDGSIVIRDAWGSEIRMVNGDIQLSAANKIVAIADTDIMSICGGMNITKADAGVQEVTNFGHIDMASGKELNMTASGNVNIVGDGDVAISSMDDIILDVGLDCLVKSERAVLIKAAADVSITANTFTTSVNYDCTLTTKTAMLRITTTAVDIVSGRTNIHSDVEISDKGYDAGEIITGELSLTTGSGSLRVGSTVTVDSGLLVKDYIMSKSSVNASQFNALNVAEQTGVYKLKNLPRVVTDVSEHKSKSQYNKANTKKAEAKLQETDPAKLMSNAFTAKYKDSGGVSSDVVIYVPGYVVSEDQRSSMSPGAHTIASARKTVYIYPGEDFWQGRYVYAPTDTDAITEDSKKMPASAITTTVKETTYYGK